MDLLHCKQGGYLKVELGHILCLYFRAHLANSNEQGQEEMVSISYNKSLKHTLEFLLAQKEFVSICIAN
jgi:hypothetical protein